MHTTKQEALYGGADLHGRNVLISLCDSEGKTVYSRRVKADLESVCKACWSATAFPLTERTRGQRLKRQNQNQEKNRLKKTNGGVFLCLT
jgi:hypothetical protein